ncbi:MAG: hypothetical protein ACI8Q1_000511 [Parvicella sp.]|jgi:hypothetical protein
MKNLYIGILLLLISYSAKSQSAPVTSICMVTVDSSSTFNIVVWERADQVSVIGIDSMLIYRQDIVGGIFNHIATVSYAAISQYEDVTADPNVQAYSYKIAGYDLMGQTGPKSLANTTMHFSVLENISSGTMDLTWSSYLGGTVNTYSCVHTTYTVGDSTLFTSAGSTQLLWVMQSPIPGVNYDMFTTANGIGGCTSTKANHNTSRSNKTTGGISLPVDVEENNIAGFSVFPNPVTNELNLNFSSRKLSKSVVSIYNMLGEMVYSIPATGYYGQQSIKLEVSNLSSGLYLISLENGSHIKTLKFSKK